MEYILFLRKHAPHLRHVTWRSPTVVGDYVHVVFDADSGASAGIVIKDKKGGLKLRWIWK